MKTTLSLTLGTNREETATTILSLGLTSFQLLNRIVPISIFRVDFTWQNKPYFSVVSKRFGRHFAYF